MRAELSLMQAWGGARPAFQLSTLYYYLSGSCFLATIFGCGFGALCSSVLSAIRG